MLNKILYTDSGTGNTQEMMKVLLDLPAFQKAAVTILHVVTPQVTTDGVAAKWEEGNQIVTDVLKNIPLEPQKISTIIRQGDPKDEVINAAKETNADLIIMGSRGLKRLEAFLQNSISQYVFQLATRPMLLVRDDIYVRKIKRVMVALDKSEVSDSALDLALFLLKDYPDGELWLARVNPDLKSELLPLSQAETEANPVISEAIAKVKRFNIPYRCVVTGGRPGEQICKLVEEKNIDLLMLGSPERRPSIAKNLPDFDRLLGSSLSDYVRVKADCPVLLVRRDTP